MTTHDSSDREQTLNALLHEFVLYRDNTPESNEPTELSVFLRQCGFTGVLERLQVELEAYIDADREAAVLEARIHSLQWALNDYNMPDTDSANNLRNFIDDLDEELEALKQKAGDAS